MYGAPCINVSPYAIIKPSLSNRIYKTSGQIGKRFARCCALLRFGAGRLYPCFVGLCHLIYSYYCQSHYTIATMLLTRRGQDRWSPFPFRRRHFQTHFLKRKGSNFLSNFIEIFYERPNKKEITIGSDNGLVLIRWQVKARTKGHDLFCICGISRTSGHWVIHASDHT